MAKGTTIGELARTVGFRGGTPNHKIAEPGHVKTLPVIDNAVPTQSNVRTSIDCYVSGQYVQKNGKVIEVTQRYTIFVSYSKDTQLQTMNEARSRIVQDYESRYGNTFNISNVYVPDLPVPKTENLQGTAPGQSNPIEMYGGTDMFRSMTRFEKVRYETATERFKAQTNIRNIRSRYGYR